MLDTLFGLIPEASRGEQWLAGDLQLVNWGGYDGLHRVRFAPTATLLCGGSGSGKSTLMDAYIALMMPHTTPFNGASNGAVTGRPRGEDQRNILSYGRGKTDETRSGDHTRVRVLRGDGEDTWTAVAMTWTGRDNARFTAVRAWYIPATARVLDDAVKVRAVTGGEFDLADLEPAAAHRLSDATVRAAGLETFSTDREFLARIHTVLGIGAAGAGSKAMNLLARIQAGQQITTVDELYKRMVLEEPATMATAEEVVDHFDELESARVRMVTARKQVRALRPLREIRARQDAAARRLDLIDGIGRFEEAESVASLWRAARRLDLLTAEETVVRTRAREAKDEVRAQTAAVDAAVAERDGLIEVLRNSGGDRLETAHRELDAAARRSAEVRRARESFDEATACLGTPVTTRAEFDALSATARGVLDDPTATGRDRDAYATARAALSAARADLAQIEEERRTVGERTGNIPAPLHEARAQLAEAAGLPETDLPFVGELVEVRTEFEPWREAFNLALGGFATTMLIDDAQLPAFRRAVETVRTRTRIRYEGVRTSTPAVTPDPARLPGRLDYRDSPFTGWLTTRLDRQFGFVCVDSADQLGEHPSALTLTGQMSQGLRGAHGGHGRRNVLGVSNRRLLADLDARIADARRRVAAAEDAERAASAGLDALDERLAAYRRVREITWDRIDVATVTAGEDRWTQLIEQVGEDAPELGDLQRRIDGLARRIDSLQKSLGRAEGTQERLAEQWAAIADEVDAATALVDDATEAGRELTTEQADYLMERCGAPGADLAAFDAATALASRRLREDRDAAEDTVAEQRDQLRRTMESFLDQWPNPNLRTDPDTSLPDFERILADLETSGLHDLEAEWKGSLLRLSGNDLTNLASTLNRARREIQERIAPINRIMADLPFYDDDHRLQISLRDNRSEARTRFLAELREVRGLIDGASSDEDRGRAYDRMSLLINRIRRTAPDVDGLIDVRNHVRVSAEKIHAASGAHVALYDHIGEKSGGESQELIAFIVGAALRYQLGDADAPRPRYAPVFLDEALIKADAHFTARAIGAWRGLGFQLIIGAPNDKYSAIEPHVDAEYDILKDTSGRSWAKPKVGVPQG
ncbi:ATP-binding protein [Corynebacterium terpenotabidum]|nr:SbcC/MukB-like Walker B domain-containing protein [Corynebacterium terpenotabidum]